MESDRWNKVDEILRHSAANMLKDAQASCAKEFELAAIAAPLVAAGWERTRAVQEALKIVSEAGYQLALELIEANESVAAEESMMSLEDVLTAFGWKSDRMLWHYLSNIEPARHTDWLRSRARKGERVFSPGLIEYVMRERGTRLVKRNKLVAGVRARGQRKKKDPLKVL
ncbi:MAG: hypothetical protein ACREIA_02810 [Opitutaceae bacterium]